MMKVARFLRILWRRWRDLWQLNWDRTTALDFHRWESKMEIQRRLSARRF